MKPGNVKVYAYSACGTCQKANKFLKQHQIQFSELKIRETPPSISELKKAKQELTDIKKLFNTSGKDYREGDWKTKQNKLSEDQIFKALSENGNLIKRPFVISEKGILIGFKEEEWKQFFGVK